MDLLTDFEGAFFAAALAEALFLALRFAAEADALALAPAFAAAAGFAAEEVFPFALAAEDALLAARRLRASLPVPADMVPPALLPFFLGTKAIRGGFVTDDPIFLPFLAPPPPDDLPLATGAAFAAA